MAGILPGQHLKSKTKFVCDSFNVLLVVKNEVLTKSKYVPRFKADYVERPKG